MNLGKLMKKFTKFAIDNYFISIFLACIAFVVLVSGYKLFFTKPAYIYVRVKVGQGLWWAQTQKPGSWFLEAIKRAKEEKDLIGQPAVQILSVTYYPWYGSGQYDVYVDAKLKVSRLGKTGKYNFKRSTIGVGAPVDFEFSSSQFSGTIIDLEPQPIKDKYVEKTVYLIKPLAYTWEFDGIKIGDKFFNGETNVIQILDKSAVEHPSTITPSRYFIDETFSQTRTDIIVKLKLKGKIVDDKFIFGNDQVVTLGKNLYIATDNFSFTDYLVSKVE